MAEHFSRHGGSRPLLSSYRGRSALSPIGRAQLTERPLAFDPSFGVGFVSAHPFRVRAVSAHQIEIQP